MTIRVLIVEDALEVRLMLRTALRFRGGFEVVGEVAEGRAATALSAELVPDVVVLDLQLPDIAGHEVLSGIRAASPATKVVVYSGRDPLQERWVVENAEGYVVKDAELDYLVDLVESVGTSTYASETLDLPRASSSVTAARRFTARTLGDWSVQNIEDALIVVSELTANAVTHGATDCTLRLLLRGAVVRVEVVDHGSGTPEPRPVSMSAEDGRGLYLVDRLSLSWGIDALPASSKAVWAELPTVRTV